MRVPASLLSWFAGHEDYLVFDAQVEGNRAQDRMILGAKAGPGVDPSNLLHEMAHFIEIDDARCCVRGWGLLTGFDEEPVITYQATERELRVIAIQKLLGEHFGVEADIPKTISSMTFMPDWWNYRSLLTADQKIKFGSKAWHALLTNHMMQNYAALEISQLRAEWDRKCQIVAARMSA